MILLDVLNKTRIKMLSQFPGVHLSGLYNLNLKIGTDSAGICRCTDPFEFRSLCHADSFPQDDSQCQPPEIALSRVFAGTVAHASQLQGGRIA